MVGGLVQQQEVELRDRRARDQHQAPPAAAERLQRRTRLHLVEAEGGEDRLGPIGEDLALPRRQALGHGFHRRQGLHLRRQHLLDGGDDEIAPGLAPSLVDLLAARQHPQQGRFTAAIGPDQPDPITLLDGEVESGEDAARPIGEAEILDAEKGHVRLTTAKGEGYKGDDRARLALHSLFPPRTGPSIVIRGARGKRERWP